MEADKNQDGAADDLVEAEELLEEVSEVPQADPESPQADEAPDQGAMVVYTGRASQRTITASDWASVGAEGQEESVWGPQNDKRIPASKFHAAALRYLTQVDSGFRVE